MNGPDEIRITGSIIQAFSICPWQAWLMSRQINPDEDNELLTIGRFISQASYSRERKEVRIKHLALDLVKREGKNLVVAEVKKSSRAKEAAVRQLLFYLYELKKMGIEAEGELLFPEERRREVVRLDTEAETEIQKLIARAKADIDQPLPPTPVQTKACSRCAYAEFCWA